jgi:hypothetical protein
MKKWPEEMNNAKMLTVTMNLTASQLVHLRGEVGGFESNEDFLTKGETFLYLSLVQEVLVKFCCPPPAHLI